MLEIRRGFDANCPVSEFVDGRPERDIGVEPVIGFPPEVEKVSWVRYDDVVRNYFYFFV